MKLGMMVLACHSSYTGGINRKIAVQASQNKNARAYLRNN
jgi:hypothetical protein